MIRTLIDIGKNLKNDYDQPLIENPYPQYNPKNRPKVLVINLTHSGELWEPNIEVLANFDDRNYRIYAFREPFTKKHPAYSLSFRLPEKTSVIVKRLGVFNRLNLKLSISLEELAKKIKEFVDKGNVNKKTPILIVFKLENKWPGKVKELLKPIFNFLLEDLAKYGKSDKTGLWKTIGICHGCGQETMVYGGVGGLLKFYTVDKYGYAPLLNPEISWRQYALCEECILDMERGKRAVDDFLTWKFYGKSFWLLPVSTGDLKNVLENFRDFHKRISAKTYTEGFETLEDQLLWEASKQEAISYHFVFLEKKQQALRILLHLDEVLPSVLSKYINTKENVEKDFEELFSELSIRGKKIFFNFFSSKNLKETTQKPGFTDEDFFVFVDKVFRRSLIDEGYIISRAMSRIRKDAIEEGKIPRISVLEVLLSLEFLLNWGILKRKLEGGGFMSEIPFSDFFEKHGSFFNHPAKIGLVLLGVLIQKFLDYQKSERGSMPFMKNLKNLRLNEKDVERIFVALQNKMNEYGISTWWGKLREGVSLSFIQAGNNWNFSPDEIGFYLVVGMALHSHPVFRD